MIFTKTMTHSFFDFIDSIESMSDTINSTGGIKTKQEQTDEHLILRGAVPGLVKDDLTISINKSDCKLLVEFKGESEFVGKFKKTFIVPNNIDFDNVKAEVENGVFLVTLPYKEQENVKVL